MSIDKKCFLVNIEKYRFKHEKVWSEIYISDEYFIPHKSIIRKYDIQNKDYYNQEKSEWVRFDKVKLKDRVLKDEIIYACSKEDLEFKISNRIRKDIDESFELLKKEIKKQFEVEVIKENYNISKTSDSSKVLENVKVENILKIFIEKYGNCYAKSFVNSEKDYFFEAEELNYIIVEGDSIFDLTKKVNKHIEKKWKPLGGVQIAGAGGDSSDGPGWSHYYFAQSLINTDV